MEAALQSYIKARRRVVRQLVESMIHEGIIKSHQIEWTPLKENGSGETVEWRLAGQDQDGRPVYYHFRGRRSFGFGRIRCMTPVIRCDYRDTQGEEETESVSKLLYELLPPDTLERDSARLASFVQELEHTALNDSLQPILEGENPPSGSLPQLEAHTSTGHPYHPCYKSRIGFTLEDHKLYAPEFAPRVNLEWIAVHESYAEVHTLSTVSYDRLLEQVLGTEQKRSIEATMHLRGLQPAEYIVVPVHPWQWRRVLQYGTGSLQAQGLVVPLGPGDDAYQPLQSIRSLANMSAPDRPNVKLSLQIMNTSALRVIGPHHVQNAAAISEWLHDLWKHDTYLRESCRVIVLRELAAVALAYDTLPAPLEALLTGSMSAIYRESIETLLEPGEEAVPYTLVTYSDQATGIPAIHSWMEFFGYAAWTSRLLEVTLQPMLHLLYCYGIGLEAHGQNMVLVHKNGWPERIALRDLPGGTRAVRCTESGLFPRRPELPELAGKAGEERHPILTDRPEDVRDYWMDALLHIQLYELSVFMREQFGLREEQFWAFAAQEVIAYQKRFPEQQEAYRLFQLGAPTIAVGQLTARKIEGDGPEREHVVPNPLSRWIPHQHSEKREVSCLDGSMEQSGQTVGR